MKVKHRNGFYFVSMSFEQMQIIRGALAVGVERLQSTAIFSKHTKSPYYDSASKTFDDAKIVMESLESAIARWFGNYDVDEYSGNDGKTIMGYLKSRRLALSLSLREVARRMERTPKFVARMESDDGDDLKVSDLTAYADAVNLRFKLKLG